MVAFDCDQLGNFYKQYSKFHDHFNVFIFLKTTALSVTRAAVKKKKLKNRSV